VPWPRIEQLRAHSFWAGAVEEASGAVDATSCGVGVAIARRGSVAAPNHELKDRFVVEYMSYVVRRTNDCLQL
jgi:hypothetical protein